MLNTTHKIFAMKCTEILSQHSDGNKLGLTVLNGNFAYSVFYTQGGLINAPLLDHSADCSLSVRAVVGGVLTQLQRGLIGFRDRRK